MRQVFVVGLLGMTMIVSVASSEEKRLKITPSVWAAFQQYLSALPAEGDGFFAVSEDGTRFGSYFCQKEECGTLGTMIALTMAQCVDSEQNCELFARRREIEVSYEISE